MKSIIIYDSYFGNTEKIACSVGEGIGEDTLLINLRTGESLSNWEDFNLVIIGSPTRGFRPTPLILSFIKYHELSGKYFASFDTRIDLNAIHSNAFRFIVHKGGYAATTLFKKLKRKKGIPAGDPEGFLVTDEKGPLKEGELERARQWGMLLRESAMQIKEHGKERSDSDQSL